MANASPKSGVTTSFNRTVQWAPDMFARSIAGVRAAPSARIEPGVAIAPNVVIVFARASGAVRLYFTLRKSPANPEMHPIIRGFFAMPFRRLTDCFANEPFLSVLVRIATASTL